MAGTFCTTTSLEVLWVGSTFTGITALASDLINDAEDELRGCLSERYNVSADAFQTSTSTPPLLEQLCKWKAIGFLYGATSRGGKDAFARSNWWLKRCDKKVDEILAYDANLVNTAGALIPDATDKLAVKSNSSTYSTTFDVDDPLLWKQDPDKLDDIDDDRK